MVAVMPSIGQETTQYQTVHAQEVSKKAVMETLEAAANWQVDNYELDTLELQADGWVNSTFYMGLFHYASYINSTRHLDWLKEIAEKTEFKMGSRRFHADDNLIGDLYNQLYLVNNEFAEIDDVKHWANEINAYNHATNLSAISENYDSAWVWCDALFMAPPTLSSLFTITGNTAHLDVMSELWFRTYEYLYDKEEHLFYRDDRYFDLKEKNGAKIFWSRGNAWVLAGLVRVLDDLPKNYIHRAKFIEIYKEMCKKIVEIQSADGTWKASLLAPELYPAPESSGTGLFCYALAWGVNNGFLEDGIYRNSAINAWQALNSFVDKESGKVQYVQKIGYAPGTADKNDTAPYGTGAILFAGVEIAKLLK